MPMSKVSWSRIMKRHPAGHLVVGVMPRSGAHDRAELEESKRRVVLLGRLVGALGPRGMYALQAQEQSAGLEVRCAFEKRADADNLPPPIPPPAPPPSPRCE